MGQKKIIKTRLLGLRVAQVHQRCWKFYFVIYYQAILRAILDYRIVVIWNLDQCRPGRLSVLKSAWLGYSLLFLVISISKRQCGLLEVFVCLTVNAWSSFLVNLSQQVATCVSYVFHPIDRPACSLVTQRCSRQPKMEVWTLWSYCSNAVQT